MRFFILSLFMLCAAPAWATEHAMFFQVKQISPDIWDYSAVWNETTHSMLYQIALVPQKIDPSIGDQAVSMSLAQKVEVVLLDAPDFLANCAEVTQAQFEYQPGLPEYLLYLTLRGSACKGLDLSGYEGAVQVRFEDVPLKEAVEPQNFILQYRSISTATDPTAAQP